MLRRAVRGMSLAVRRCNLQKVSICIKWTKEKLDRMRKRSDHRPFLWDRTKFPAAFHEKMAGRWLA